MGRMIGSLCIFFFGGEREGHFGEKLLEAPWEALGNLGDLGTVKVLWHLGWLGKSCKDLGRSAGFRFLNLGWLFTSFCLYPSLFINIITASNPNTFTTSRQNRLQIGVLYSLQRIPICRLYSPWGRIPFPATTTPGPPPPAASPSPSSPHDCQQEGIFHHYLPPSRKHRSQSFYKNVIITHRSGYLEAPHLQMNM